MKKLLKLALIIALVGAVACGDDAPVEEEAPTVIIDTGSSSNSANGANASNSSNSSNASTGSNSNPNNVEPMNAANNAANNLDPDMGGEERGLCPDASPCGAGSTCVGGACVPDRALRFSIVWDAAADIDLVVTMPEGETIDQSSTGDTFEYRRDGCAAPDCVEGASRVDSIVWGRITALGVYEYSVVNRSPVAVNYRVEIYQAGQLKMSTNGSVPAMQGARSEASSVCIGTEVYATLQDCQAAYVETLSCLEQLDYYGVQYSAWNYSTQTTSTGARCGIDDPIYVSSPINGITYNYVDESPMPIAMACPLAVQLVKFAEVLESHNIDEVEHIGVFNCRMIAGTSLVSEHGYARAIDFAEFRTRDGKRYNLLDHWEHNTNTPQTPEGQVLIDIALQMANKGIFNMILTPNYNAAHDNHFHVDLTPGVQYLGYVHAEPVVSSEEALWDAHCP